MGLPSLAVVLLVVCCCCVGSGRVVKRSDDVNTAYENLQVLVQQQAAVVSSLQARVTVLENKVSKAVAFTAMFSHDDAAKGIPLSQHTTLIFDNAITNAGNGYNPTNGIFTAPVAGYYAFGLSVMEPEASTHPALGLSIVKNGVAVDMAWATGTVGGLDETASTHSVHHLALGDQVWIRQENGDGVRGSYLTVFTGYLVHTE